MRKLWICGLCFHFAALTDGSFGESFLKNSFNEIFWIFKRTNVILKKGFSSHLMGFLFDQVLFVILANCNFNSRKLQV